MPKTQIKQRETFYNRLMREDAENVNAGQEYRGILTSLRTLMEKTDALDQKNGEMSAEDHVQISKIYMDLYQQCDKHMKTASTPFDMSRNNIVKELKRVLGKDMVVLSKMDREHPGNYKDAVKEARTTKVDATGRELSTKGGALSSRIPLKFANGKTGFFTKASYFDQENQWKDVVKEYSGKFPREIRSNLNRLVTDPAFRKEYSHEVAGVERTDKNKIMRLLGFSEEFINNSEFGLQDDDPRMVTLDDFIDATYSLCNALEISIDGAGIPVGCRIDQRNVAMSSIAKLIHCEDLIANAIPMEMVHGNVKYQGTFMEKAEGVDIYNLEINSPFRKYGASSFQTPQLYEKLGNIQVLDYICGNVDRHEGNMLYSFDDGEPPKIIGIKGIDNDMSFGTKTFDKPEDMMMCLAHPEQMGMLSEKTAMTVMALNEDVLRTVLMDKNLSKEEIDAAWKRTQNLQKAIDEKKIKLVKDGEWEQAMKTFDASKYPQSQYSSLRYSLIQRKMALNQGRNLMGRGVRYSDVSSDQLHMEIKSRSVDLKEKAAVIRKLDRHFGSKEFDAMRDSLYRLSKEYERIDKMLTNNQSPEKAELENLQNMQEVLARNTQEYINAKKLQPGTERGRLKLEVAKALQDIVLDSAEFRLEELEMNVQPHTMEDNEMENQANEMDM